MSYPSFLEHLRRQPSGKKATGLESTPPAPPLPMGLNPPIPSHGMMRAKINVNLPVTMIEEMNREVGRGVRSRFIERAIRARLDQQSAFSPSEVSTRQLLAMIHARELEISPALRQLILAELQGEL